MSDGRNAFKLPGDHIDFNVPETFDFLVSFVPSDISVRHEIQGDKRIEL